MNAIRSSSVWRLALFAAALWAVPASRASFELVNLGTNSFTIDSGSTTAIYSQTSDSLVFDSSFALGDTLGGTFAEQNWSSYGTFGLGMSLIGTNSNLAFTVGFYDASLNVINYYQGSTASPGSEPFVAMLSLSLTGNADFSRVAGMQFTWDAPGAINATITEIIGFSQPTSGFFVARAPGGALFLTGTNTAPFETKIAAEGDQWIPASFVTISLPPGAASWAMLCDSNAKTAVSALDHSNVMRSVARLPVNFWKYKVDPSHRHIGPMAQDFHAAFGLGADDETISTLDADGVAMSALKGLIAELRARQKRSAGQEIRLRELEEEVRLLRNVLKQFPPNSSP